MGVFPLTTRRLVGLEEIRQQALLDGGVPAQGLLVKDEQEAVELHQELIQHWKTKKHQRDSDLQRNQNSFESHCTFFGRATVIGLI